MANRPLAEIIQQMSGADRVLLPAHPELAEQITACSAKPGAGSSHYWSLVSADPSLVCALLREANADFYAGLQKTLTIEEVVTRLGRDRACRVVQRACGAIVTPAEGGPLSRYLPRLWQHARGCALGAQWLAERCGGQGLACRAYLAGLLHDMGKLFLLAALEDIATSCEGNMELSDPLIREILATMHADQGLRLCEAWSFPEVYKKVVAEHHDEQLDTGDMVLVLVQLANKTCRKIGLGLDRQPDIVLPTTGEAQFLGVDEMALAELEIMLEDSLLCS